MKGFIKVLKEKGRLEIKNFGVFEILPRKKGRSFCGFSGKEGKPKYSKRVRFTSSKELRDTLCK